MFETKNLDDYTPIVGSEVIKRIRDEAKKIKNKHIVTISSTYIGGGVAEMLNSTIPLYNELGIKFGWRTLHGTNNFFNVSKSIHNAIQGEEINLSKDKKQIYYETNRRFAKFTHIEHDLVVVHDPQPLPMIDFYKKEQPWILRIHPEFSAPNRKVYKYLKTFIEKYDHIILSKKEYLKKGLSSRQSIIYPAIDPLSYKNMGLDDKTIKKELDKKGIKKKKLMITEVSRFDKWKGFPGLVRAFEMTRKKMDAQLVICGAYASDDPEGEKEYRKIVQLVEKSNYKKDIQIVFGDEELFVNALQRTSDIIVQNSSKEGFGLTVSEALYKGTPVVATEVGGIPLQVINGKTGYLYKPGDIESLSEYLIKLGRDKELRKRIGSVGKEHVIKNFLITRLMLDWIDLFADYLSPSEKLKNIGGNIISKIISRNHN